MYWSSSQNVLQKYSDKIKLYHVTPICIKWLNSIRYNALQDPARPARKNDPPARPPPPAVGAPAPAAPAETPAAQAPAPYAAAPNPYAGKSVTFVVYGVKGK